MLTFLVKKSEIKLSGVSIFLEYAKKNLKSNVVLVVVLVLESKGLYYHLIQSLIVLSSVLFYNWIELQGFLLLIKVVYFYTVKDILISCTCEYIDDVTFVNVFSCLSDE